MGKTETSFTSLPISENETGKYWLGLVIAPLTSLFGDETESVRILQSGGDDGEILAFLARPHAPMDDANLSEYASAGPALLSERDSALVAARDIVLVDRGSYKFVAGFGNVFGW